MHQLNKISFARSLIYYCFMVTALGANELWAVEYPIRGNPAIKIAESAYPSPKVASLPSRITGLPVISDNGRYIAYITNVVRKGGKQQRNQIFLWDAVTKNKYPISRDDDNDQDNQAEGNSMYPAISADGSRVVYGSDAHDIDADCTNGQMNIYMRIWDQMKSSDCISKPQSDQPSLVMSILPAVSGDGKTISWASNTTNQVEGDVNGYADVFVWTNRAGIRLASVASDGTQGNAHSSLSSLDQTGNKLVFMSEASNLVAGDVNQASDIFFRDLTEGQTSLISVSSTGEPGNQLSTGPMISRDGKHVVFVSKASNLVPNDTNDKFDVFVRHLDTGMTERVSLADDNLVSEANDDSAHAGITGNGRCVIFQSKATNLVTGDANSEDDIFVRDLLTHRTTRVSLGKGGREANGDSFFPAISADGTTVAYTSNATRHAKGSDSKRNDPDVYVDKLPEGLCH